MNHTEEQQIYQAAIEKFGLTAQEDMLIEEMAELTQAILKHRRKPSLITHKNLHEEFADVDIVMQQIKLILKHSLLAAEKQQKLERLKELVK